MLFNSLIFLIFAAIFFAVWPLARRSSRSRWGWIFLASLIFYGWWDWRFIGLILFSGLIDFFAGLGMQRFPARRRLLLLLSITANVGTLGVFKYLGFLVTSINDVATQVGGEAVLPVVSLTLPVGISFYTFQSMSYTIDVYRGELRPTRSFLHFFAYLSMFPQLVAGPIIRASDLLPQLETWQPTTALDRWDGLRLMVHGFFKKMVIADNLAPAISEAFGRSSVVGSTPFWWIVVTMFAAQIYCDFSGYSDIARGLARWMGYRFPINFAHPFVAKSLREFWARWHISLTTWFRDYVYQPLGGPVSGFRGHWNVWVTMTLSGLWHGAAWTFVLWGFSQGVFLSLERLLDTPKRLLRLPVGRVLCTLLVVAQIWSAFALFRASSMAQAMKIMREMYVPTHWNWRPVLRYMEFQKMALIVLAVFILREMWFYFGLDEKAWKPLHRPAVQVLTIAAMVVACVFLRGPGIAFVYFQF